MSVCMRRCLLEQCGDQLLILGEYLLRLLELLDRPLSWLIAFNEHLFERIKQFVTSSFPTSSEQHWPETEPDDWESLPPAPPQRQLPSPSPYNEFCDYTRLQERGLETNPQAPLDLSLRHSSHDVQATDRRYQQQQHVLRPHASATLARSQDSLQRTAPRAQTTSNAQVAAPLDWNPQRA